MTAEQLIKALQDLGQENLQREIVIFDGPSYCTPTRVEILNDPWSKKLQGLIMID